MMMTIQEQFAAPGEAAIAIRTLNVRVAPLTLAMLDQVLDQDSLDCEVGARGEIGPTQRDGPKVRVLAWLESKTARIELTARDLTRPVAAREERDAELAALVTQLAAVDQVFLL